MSLIPATYANIGDTHLTPIEKRISQIDFINTMKAEHPLFETYYDPVNIRYSEGGSGNFYGSQMADGPIPWQEKWMFDQWPQSEDLKCTLPLLEYGLFGDKTSQDFAKLVFQPEILEQHLAVKYDLVAEGWKRATTEVILYHLCDKAAYKEDTAIIELEKDYFSPDKGTLEEKRERAYKFIHLVEEKLYSMKNYSRDFNKAEKEAVLSSLKQTIAIFDYSVNTFLNTFGYAPTYNVNYVDLQQKVGKLVVTNLPNYQKGDLIPRPCWKDDPYSETTPKAKIKNLTTDDSHIANWKALIHHKDFHKIRDVINRPQNDGVFIETGFYNIQLTNLIGKWYYAIQGNVDFVPAIAFIEKSDEEEEYEEEQELTLEKDYRKLKDNSKPKAKVMAKYQMEEWLEAGFDFKGVNEWLDAGLKVSDAKFAYWLKNTQNDEDYQTAEDYKVNVGNYGKKTEEELRGKFGESEQEESY